MKRREMIAGIATLGFAGCRETLSNYSVTPAAVKVTYSRVLKSRVGLRPVRRSGFRLGHDRLIGRDVLHNYGHGGDGFTVSWPCANWVGSRARLLNARRAIVIGGGVSGLTTACALLERGIKVTVIADSFSPDVTSYKAAAIILKRVKYRSGFQENDTPTDATINSMIGNRFQLLSKDKSTGVRQIRHHNLLCGHEAPGTDVRVFFGRPQTMETITWVVDPTVYLPYLMALVLKKGGRLKQKWIDNFDQFPIDQQTVLVNCSGLGAKRLASDSDLFPVRGQLTLLKPQKEVDYSYTVPNLKKPLYMAPHSTAIVLGGSYEVNSTSLKVDASETFRHIEQHRRLFTATSSNLCQ